MTSSAIIRTQVIVWARCRHCSQDFPSRLHWRMSVNVRIKYLAVMGTIVLSGSCCKRAAQYVTWLMVDTKIITAELRSIIAPGGIGVANVDGGPIFDQRLPDKSFWGPFATIQDFHRELRHGLELRDNEEAFPGLRELIEFHNGPWQRPVFTHGDLSSLNIMAVDDKVTGIVDWESAGWMPPYWEYTSAWNVNPHNVFWRDAVDGFLTPLPHELEMETIRRQYFGEF
ncbi:hypothetical protein FLAG1_10995 [Fusarium langsethiae]|uniref:Aminoglycoside phosphotransferase domain-containing protein n=1 Tax=Fusarium langsethiae TaxID=179993 RepID=A0A0M9EMT1_FUSLA|nr:hypothetical protein FLAG1_10995 [Fusarium langsethiae]